MLSVGADPHHQTHVRIIVSLLLLKPELLLLFVAWCSEGRLHSRCLASMADLILCCGSQTTWASTRSTMRYVAAVLHINCIRPITFLLSCHVVTKSRYTPFIAACTSLTGNVDVVVWTLEVLGCNKFQLADVSLIRASWLQPLESARLMLFCRMAGMASSSRAARATWTSRNTFLALVSVQR